MIPRYARAEMVELWSTQTKYRTWFEIEANICDALAKIGKIPQSAAINIRKRGEAAQFDLQRIEEIETVVKHDVIAFLTHLGEIVGEDARFIHLGLTSSDLLDTSFNLTLMRSTDILLAQLEKLLTSLKNRAMEYKYTMTIGRTHGVHAEPTSFGAKLAYSYSEFLRCKNRLKAAYEEIAVCAISGAVGSFANIDPAIEAYVAEKLHMKIEPISTQIIPRDRHAMFFATLGVIASCIERFATEIRHLQRTEILEVAEGFSNGQKGSSAMPHKRNPILSENLTGLARIIRSYTQPALENIVLWHERDISHSSVERFIGPDACITLDFALSRLTNIVETMIVYPENMLKNLEKLQGLIHSQQILLALTQKGLSREKAYEIVQNNTKKVWDNGNDFFNELAKDPLVKKHLPMAELKAYFDNSYHLTHIDTIFQRVFKGG
ncbi:adenylosuccinate lyase [Bartonella sp. TP]|uniref:adenylosuccinate lyase n=1 Tax=Bartonella sp. TP TaxID=3057550 RepID=UPI0025B0DDBB|nr:adenylosuccinate lyase [Bartonella sp. TP]WJW79921.1 adenylosuccinate lyase [Bartonella sp. TP]